MSIDYNSLSPAEKLDYLKFKGEIENRDELTKLKTKEQPTNKLPKHKWYTFKQN